MEKIFSITNADGIQTLVAPDGHEHQAEEALAMWFQTLPSEVLASMVAKLVDVRVAAAKDLSLRGCDPLNDLYIGFEKARAKALALQSKVGK
ncbi:MAG TPA: hypothetical protein DCF63_11900 [Planctomycetaceae bacterium]|nr:hypothetical protein [Planctomycetaceae bacterium]